MDGFGTDGETAAAQSVLRQALAALVAPEGEGGTPQPQDLADVLWISRLAGLGPLPDGDPRPPADQPATPPPVPPDRTGAQPHPHDRPTEPRRPADPVPPADPKVELHPRSTPTPTPTPTRAGTDHPARGAEVVQVTRPTALPGALAIARALRPLRRPLTQRPGGRRPLHLDEEATAEATAEAGVLLPVWQRAQPRYSVDLLVDTGATMAVWHDLARELATLLERHGAFEEVRTWSLDTDRETPHLTPFRRRRTAAPPPPAPDRNWSRPLADPHVRRILFVLTDGVGPAWYGGELVPFLARTAATGPAAALQVLPRRLWHRTALRPAPVEARAATHGRPVPVLRTESTLPGIPRGRAGESARASVGWLPVLEIDADWLAPWADLTAGRTTGWTPMLAAPLSGIPRPPRPRSRDTAPRPPADRVAAFRAGSSPNAYRLACHLAAAPLSLPVMRLVQRSTVPDSGQRELAELFLSGLIEVREKAVDPDEVVYDFVDGVREELLGELTRTESVRVLEHVLAKVSGRVAATFGGTLDFRALATATEQSRHRLPERSRPFAEVAAAVLAGAGGQHASIARHLSSAVSDPKLRWELLTPPPPIASPPDPPRMIGRREELAQLAQACEPGGGQTRLVAIEVSPGMGRRRLVQEYVQRHGDRHSFVHYIGARTAQAVSTGFERLRAALGADASDDLGEAVRAHPNWLIILDDLGTGVLYPREFAQLMASESGCLLVTADSAEGRPFLRRRTTTITLGFLTEAELREEIRHRLGDAYQRIEHAQEFQHLLDRMPRRPDELAAWHLDEQLDALVGRAGSGDSYSTVRSYRLPSPALAMATVMYPDCVAVYGTDHLIRFIDMTTGQETRPSVELEFPLPDIVAMAEPGNAPFILCTAESGGGLRYWETRNGSFVTSRSGAVEPLAAMAPIVHVDGRRYLWTADLDGRMRLWSPQDASEVAELPSLVSDRRSWTVTTLPQPDGPSLLIGVDPTGRLHRWRPDDPSTVEFFAAAVVDPGRARTIVGITGDETRCVIASIGDRDTHVHIWEFEGRWRRTQHREVEQPLIGDQFRLLQRIAQGRQSEVWRARDEQDGSIVAVKSFDRDRLSTVLEPEVFLEQAGRLLDLDHRGLVGFRRVGIDRERFYLAMEFIDNPDLRTVLEAAGPLPANEVAAIAHGVAEALDYLHTHGLAHGRIGPANILIRPDGSPALCDFGIDLSGSAVADPAGDLLALGNLLLQIGVPEVLQGLVLELLHPDPRRRPTATEVARRIDFSGALRQSDRTPAPALRFTLLGEVRAWRGDEPLDLGPPERKAVLAALLKYRGRPVRAEVLIEAVRSQHTSSAHEIDQIWLHVQELERVLNSVSAPRAVVEELSDGRTWVLNVAAEQIDAVLFERSLEQAETAMSAGHRAAARLHAEEAVALWQGPPLADVPGPSAELERARLTELFDRAQDLLLQTEPTAGSGDTRLSYRLLGPLCVLRGGVPRPVGSPMQQAVLAALLLHAPAPVPIASLVNAVFGDQPPDQAMATVRTYVSRLRHVLGDGARPRGAADILQSVSDGYRLTVEPGSLDVAVFEQRLAQAEQNGDLIMRHALLQSALDLWDGPALDGVPGPYASWERTRLTERMRAASEERYVTVLALGRHREVLTELEVLVAESPLRERSCALLMLAQYRCGLPGEAIESYRRLHDRLSEEFGIEPGPAVRRLHRMIRAADPELHRLGQAEALLVPQGGTAVPAGVDIDRLPRGDAPQGVAIGLDVAEQAPAFVDFEGNPLFAVFGDAGSGKTALLRLLVKQLTERYTSEEVGFLVVDFRRELLDEVPPGYLVHYASSLPDLATLVRILRVAATVRTPGSQRQKDVFLIVDDVDLVTVDGDGPLSSLLEFLPQVRELGLRVIVARRCEGAGRARATQPFLGAVCDLGTHGVVLPGHEQEGPLLGAVAPQPLPPGQGIQVTPETPSGTLIRTGWMPTRNGW